MLIKKLVLEEIREALPLIHSVFCECVAKNYEEDSRLAFFKAINNEEYINMLSAYGAYDGDQLVGIIATREKGRQIALFFVKGEYQRQGIGRKLFENCLENNNNSSIYVHSSKYAFKVYEELGFFKCGDLTIDKGIRYIPMVLKR